MKTTIAKGALVLTIFLLGVILGPPLLALIEAAMVENNRSSRLDEADHLIAAYQSQLPRNVLFLSVVRMRGGDCGYEDGQLFPSPKRHTVDDDNVMNFFAADMIENWKNEEHDRTWISAIAGRIGETHSAFSIAFLRRCIEATAMSPFCASYVSKFGDEVERYPSKAKPTSNNVVAARAYCSFMDGIAARQGIPLVSRDKQQEAIN